MSEATGIAPKRKAKQQLTLIPEEGRAISYRFEVSLVGKGVKEFAKKACENEMAEAFHPKGWHAGQEDEHTTTPGETAASGDVSNKGDKAGQGSLTLFCPLGEAMEKKGLARIRFVCIENFSDALPVHKEKLIAMNSAIIFLFWRVENSESATEELLSDYTTRLAELRHGSTEQCKPYTVLHAYEADKTQEGKLKEFCENGLGKLAGVLYEHFEYDDEGTIMDNMTTLCEKMIEYQTNARATVALPKSDGAKKGSPCCTIS